MLFKEALPQCVRAFVSAADRDTYTAEITRLGLAEISPEEARGAYHNGRMFFTDNSADHLIIKGVGIRNDRHPKTKREPEIPGEPENMEIRQVCKHAVLPGKAVYIGQAHDVRDDVTVGQLH